jgi:hypothetical protein
MQTDLGAPNSSSLTDVERLFRKYVQLPLWSQLFGGVCSLGDAFMGVDSGAEEGQDAIPIEGR